MNGLIKIFCCLTLVISSFFNLSAQSPRGTVGSWWMVFNQTRISNRISLHSEFQYRSYNIGLNAGQLLPRVGVNYHFNKNIFISAGYAWIPNYAYDKDDLPGIRSKENRVWQAFQARHKTGKVVWDHRVRQEQRWIESNGNTQNKHRFRYALRTTIPLNKPTLTAETVFLTFYDEIFLNLSKNTFDRNRLYGAVGYHFTPLVNLQLGYMAQTVGSTTKLYLQTALNYNLDFRRK